MSPNLRQRIEQLSKDPLYTRIAALSQVLANATTTLVERRLRSMDNQIRQICDVIESITQEVDRGWSDYPFADIEDRNQLSALSLIHIFKLSDHVQVKTQRS